VALPLARRSRPRRAISRCWRSSAWGSSARGFLLFMAGARLIPAAESSLIGMLETVLGPLWVWLVLSERPATATLTGGALILAALVANTLHRSPDGDLPVWRMVTTRAPL